MRAARGIRFAGVVVVISGCYSAAAPLGAPCDPNAPSCPEGQMCVMRAGGFVCAGRGGDDPDGGGSGSGSGSGSDATNLDGDGDGVLDASDNCASIANPNQAN